MPSIDIPWALRLKQRCYIAILTRPTPTNGELAHWQQIRGQRPKVRVNASDEGGPPRSDLRQRIGIGRVPHRPTDPACSQPGVTLPLEPLQHRPMAPRLRFHVEQ